MTNRGNVEGALTGVRVLSFAQLAQGPAAVQLLADLGADVIKVERPGVGAWERGWSGKRAFVNGESLFFLGFNRNQRDLTVDLKDPRGKEVVRRLVERTDVVVENFRPGVMDRLGLGYDDLAAINPGLVYCSATGFGPEGPYKERAGQDLILQAESGLVSVTGRAGDPPTPTGAAIVDIHAAALMAFGIVAALLARQRTGRGQRVETSLLEAALHLQMEPLVYYLNGGFLRQRSEAGLATTFHAAPYGIYATRDGHLALSINPLPRLAEVLGIPELLGFSEEDANERPDAIKRLIEPVIRTRTTAEWLAALAAADVWAGAVNTYADLEEHPQVRALDAFATMRHARAGEVKVLRSPVRLSGSPRQEPRPAPLLGEHTDDILRDLGYGDDDIDELRRNGVV